MRRLALLALVLLGACSGGTTADPGQAACERVADSDPAVVEGVRKQAGNLDYQWQNADQLRIARQQAVLRCLRARGLAPKGGVEVPRR